jgi:hypothetical protein
MSATVDSGGFLEVVYGRAISGTRDNGTVNLEGEAVFASRSHVLIQGSATGTIVNTGAIESIEYGGVATP